MKERTAEDEQFTKGGSVIKERDRQKGRGKNRKEGEVKREKKHEKSRARIDTDNKERKGAMKEVMVR